MFNKIVISLISFAFVSCGISQHKINDLPHDLEETSGLQLLSSGHLASVNDSGNPEEIFILSQAGKVIKKIKVKGATNTDWEALSSDQEGRLYIGNFGNNDNNRKNLEIVVFPKDFESQSEAQPEYTISFHYEDQQSFPPEKGQWRFDCEAFVVLGDDIFLFSKSRVHPFDGKTYVYKIPNQKGNHLAKKIGSFQLDDHNMYQNWVTDASYHAKSKRLAILTTKKVYYFNVPDGEIIKASQLKKTHTQTLQYIKQREAITFNSQGDALYVTDEKHRLLGGGNLYTLKIKNDE